MSTRRSLLWVLVCLVLVAGVSAAAASRVKSREQAIAEAEPPARTVLTATVERRVLSNTVLSRATVVPEAFITVPAPAVPEDSQPVVTALPVPVGDQIAEGTLIAEVAGRPIFVLLGRVPSYRPLRPGEHGADVAQLQEALGRLGYGPADADGVFGAATKDAVTAFYSAHGYEPSQHLPAGPQGLADAETETREAQADLTTAELSGDPSASAAAQEAVRIARDAEQRLRETTGAMVAMGEIVFVPTGPVWLESQTTAVGGRADPNLGTLAAGRPRLEAIVKPSDAELLEAGQAATADDEARTKYEVTVSSIGTVQTDAETGDITQRITLDANSHLDLPEIGTNLRLTFIGAATDGKVLVVPLAAVTSNADGRSRVTLVDDDGKHRQVVVLVGLSADGFVEVQDESDELREGDEVVVGT